MLIIVSIGFSKKKSPTSTRKLVGKDVDKKYVDYRLHCMFNGIHTQPGRELSQYTTPFVGLLGSSAEEGRAKPRYYSV
jgi:hypothetical protein